MTWPISFQDVLDARDRIRPHLSPTPLRRYVQLDEAVGHGIEVWVKHENHQPTNAFKARNGLSVLTALSEAERSRGVVAASTGNHGQAVVWSAGLFGSRAVICVPENNNPAKNAAMLALGAELVEEGRWYDDAVEVADRLAAEQGLTVVHSTNDARVIAGAATVTLEILEQQPDLDALVVAVGGGSQSVGALTVVRELAPHIEVFGVQAANASAIHDSWHAGEVIVRESADTIAEGLATLRPYDMTFEALREGLRDFVVATEDELAAAVRLLISTTHNMAEPSGAAGLAGLTKLRERLAGKKVGIVVSGANVADDVLESILARR